MGGGGYINHVEETAGKKETANIYEYQHEHKDKEGKSPAVSFRRQPVTDEDVLYIQRYTTVYLE